MTFIIRQLSRTAEGREIVRTAKHEGASIAIGRDAGSEVHLADLAVELHHARVAIDGRGQLEVESSCGLPFDTDGRSTLQARIDPATGAELRFGGHRIGVSAEEGAPVLTVERVEALSDASEAREEIGLFTLKGLLPGRRPVAWSLIGVVLLIFLIWPIFTYATSHGVAKRSPGFHADRMWSSGPLSVAHKSLMNNCQACHVNKFEAVRDTACLTCHKDDAHAHADPARIALAKEGPGLGGRIKGLFQAAFNHPAGRCVDCHTEHEGAGRMPPTAQAFCTDCHASLNTRLTDTKLKNASDFGTDHPQFMPAVTAGTDAHGNRLYRRISFDAHPVDNNGLKFPHASHLARGGSIARMAQTMKAEYGFGDSLACKDCHMPTADGTRFKPVEMERNCGMCHSLAFDRIGGTFRTLRHGEPAQVVADLRAFYRSTGPDRPISLGGMARRRPGDYAAVETAQDYVAGARAYGGQAEGAIAAVFSRGGACFDCHVVTPTGNGAVPFQIRKVFQPDRYMKKGWFDHNAHRSESCGSCHAADRSRTAADLLLPDLASCRTCHVGESGAKLRPVKTPVESSCAMCHDYHIDAGAPWLAREKVDRAKGQPRFAPAVAGAR